MLFHVEVTAQDAELERHESDGLIYDGGDSESYAGGSSTSTLTPATGGGGSSSTTGQSLEQRRTGDRTQRPVPVRIGQEVQALPRAGRVDAHAERARNRCRGVEGPPGVGP